ncbi:MAG TPA: hypothetical protein VGL86_32380 [Polyangia bacterium]
MLSRAAAASRVALVALLAVVATVGGAGDVRAQGDDDVVQRPDRLTAGVSDQLLGQLAPDGHTLYFVSNRNTTNELYSQQQAAPGAKLVFDEGADVTWPRLSPDGKRILYISFRDDAAGRLCVRDLPDRNRRCYAGDGSAVQAQWIDGAHIVLVSRDSAEGDLRLVAVAVGKTLSGHTLVQRNLTSPTISPDGRWIVYVPVQRYAERVGPGFAARAAQRLEAMRLDRPSDPPVALSLELPGLTGQPAFGTDGRYLFVTQFLDDTNGDGAVDASDHGVLFRVRFESARDDAPVRAAAAWPEQLTESTWNCEYPSPSPHLLITTCTRAGGGGLDVYSLPLDGQVPSDWSAERLALEVELSARRSEQTLMYRHLLSKTTTATGRRQLMMRLVRLHLAAEELDAADFYAKKVKLIPDRTTAGVASALRVWVEHRRALRGREKGRMAAEFVSESRARFDALDPAKQKSPSAAALALKHIVRSEIADTIGDKDVARSELEAVVVADVPLPSVLEAYYERADALYRELGDADALAAAARALADHPALPADVRLKLARAAVRALVRGRSYDEADAILAKIDAPPDSELAFAVALARVVNRIRNATPAREVRDAIVALYKQQTRADRHRAIMLDAVGRAARLEADMLVEELAQHYVDDVPRGTQERRRAERLFERVMLSRAYRRMDKGHLDHARDVFQKVAATTGSLEAHVGYVDLRLREGATPLELRDEYARRGGDGSAPIAEFVRAYLTARELPSLTGAARTQAIAEALARLRRVSPALRGKPEPQVVWGALLHEQFLDDRTLASAQKANLHYLLALELVARNPRYRSHVLDELALVQSEVGNWRIALGYLQDRDKLPIADDLGGIEHRLVEARAFMHLDREADAAKAADGALAAILRHPADAELAALRPLVLDRDALYHLAAGRFDRALALYDALMPTLPPADARNRDAARNLVVAHLGRAAAALGHGDAKKTVADLDVVDGKLADDALGAALAWPHTTPATTLRGYRLMATGLRANAHLRLGELDRAQAALERRRALAAGRLGATKLDEHLRGLGLVEARLADVAHDRKDVAAANRWLGLALADADRWQQHTGVPLHADALDLLRFAAELRLDGQLTLALDLPARLDAAVAKLAAEHDPKFRVAQRWLEVDAALLAPAAK